MPAFSLGSTSAWGQRQLEVFASLDALAAGSLLLSELLDAVSVALDSLASEEPLAAELSLSPDLLSEVSLEPFSAGRLGRP